MKTRKPGLWFPSTKVEVEDVRPAHRKGCAACKAEHMSHCVKCKRAHAKAKAAKKLYANSELVPHAPCAEIPPTGRRLKLTNGSGRHQTILILCQEHGEAWIKAHAVQGRRAVRYLRERTDEAIRG